MENPILFTTIGKLLGESLDTILRLREPEMPYICTILASYTVDDIKSSYETYYRSMRTSSTMPQAPYRISSAGHAQTRYPSWASTDSCTSSGLSNTTGQSHFSAGPQLSTTSFDPQSRGSQNFDSANHNPLGFIPQDFSEVKLDSHPPWPLYTGPSAAAATTQPSHMNATDSFALDSDYSIGPSRSGYPLETQVIDQQRFPKPSSTMNPMFAPEMGHVECGYEQYSTYHNASTDAPETSLRLEETYINSFQPQLTQSPVAMSPEGQGATSIRAVFRAATKPRQKIWCPYRGCKKTYSSKHEFEQHVLADHEQSDTYICAHDERRFYRLSDLRSHHSKDFKDCQIANPAECEQHLAHERKRNWGCSLCKALFFNVEAWVMHHVYHVQTEKKKKSDCDFSIRIHSLLSQKTIALQWDAHMTIMCPSVPTVQYHWDEDASDELLDGLEWGKFRGELLLTPEIIEKFIDHAISVGTKSSGARSSKRPASSSPSMLMRMTTMNSPVPSIDLSRVPSYDNGVEDPLNFI